MSSDDFKIPQEIQDLVDVDEEKDKEIAKLQAKITKLEELKQRYQIKAGEYADKWQQSQAKITELEGKDDYEEAYYDEKIFSGELFTKLEKLTQQHQHLMKALDEGKLEEVILNFIINDSGSDWHSKRLAKAIVNHIKSKLTGGV